MNDMVKNVLLWVVIAGVLMTVFNRFGVESANNDTVSYTQFLNNVKSGRVANVEIDGRKITGRTDGNQRFITYSPETNNTAMVGDLLKANVDVKASAPQQQSILMQIFISWFPFLLIIGLWVFFLRQMQGGGNGRGAMSFGKSKAKMLNEDQIKVTFKDVAGIEEAKEEVGEIVEFLRDPSRFQKLGGMIPRGILMAGSPGTGKTLLAKAIAGEAKVPFFSISGSDFVEMFVGVGASRVRDMFDQAKKNAPCIIFIDEIDAVGRQRGAGLGGGHDEREQTLNQLLVEMDGFEGNEGVIIIAATNRPDVLDPALLRPGRFDRQVVVPLPDVRGREKILSVHMKKVPLADDIKPSVLARATPGFSGADLANLVNEAALFAARRDLKKVTMQEFEDARDKIMMGAARKSHVMTEDDKKLTAYHEAGHAIVGWTVPSHDPIHKVTIMPRGRALGVTFFLPEGESDSLSLEALNSKISTAYGGRIAEEMINGADGITTGASSDIDYASNLARNMVTRWGLSQKLGPISYGEDDAQPFLGRSASRPKAISDATANLIDQEVQGIIDQNYRRAETILQEKVDILHAMAKALLKYETIDSEQVDAIMNGKTPKPPKDWIDDSDDSSNGDTVVLDEEESTDSADGALDQN